MTRPNVVYISELLKEKYPHASSELLSVLRNHNVTLRELKCTKDVWCRDYMPVQNRKGELIQFKYDPSYLKGKEEWESSRSDIKEVCVANGIQPDYCSDINLDGGNVVLFGNKAIITDRVFKENPNRDKEEILCELERLLDAKVIVIRALSASEDMTGHADGMVRFVDEHTILGNDLTTEYKYIRESINKACNRNGLVYESVPVFYPKYDKKEPLSAIGIYVNYLEVNDLIVLPVFNVENNRDKEVVDLFHKIFPDRIIETINYNEVALQGGLLNCTTWTITE